MKLKPFCARVSYIPSQKPEFDVKRENICKTSNKINCSENKPTTSANEWEVSFFNKGNNFISIYFY